MRRRAAHFVRRGRRQNLGAAEKEGPAACCAMMCGGNSMKLGTVRESASPFGLARMADFAAPIAPGGLVGALHPEAAKSGAMVHGDLARAGFAMLLAAV